MANDRQVCQFRVDFLALAIHAAGHLLKQLLGGNLLFIRQVFDILAQRVVEGLQLFQNAVFQRQLPLALGSGEEVEHINAFMLSANAVNTAHALHDPCGVPRQVIVDQHVRPVKVDTFCQNVSGNQQIVFVVVPALVLWIEAVFNLSLRRSRTLAAVINNPAIVERIQGIIKIFSGFHGFSKYDDLPVLHHRIGSQVSLEFHQFGVNLDTLPHRLPSLQLGKVHAQIADEGRGKLFRIELPKVAFLYQLKQLLIIAAVQQVVEVFDFAHINSAAFIHLDEAFIGINEPLQRLPEGIEAAFKALDKHALHEASHVSLACKQCGVFFLVLQIQQWRVA